MPANSRWELIQAFKSYTERNGVWVPEDGDSCHKTGKIDR